MDTMGDEVATNPNTAASAVEGGDVGENPSLGEIGLDAPGSLSLAVGPPSPLTGCYLLIVIGEPYSQEHKDIIIQKLLKGEFAFRSISPRKVSHQPHEYHFSIIFLADVSSLYTCLSPQRLKISKFSRNQIVISR